MTTSIPLALVVGAAILSLLAGCVDDDAETSDKVESIGLEPNGVAEMKPGRAMAVARKAMNELHDAVYEGTMAVEVEGVTRRINVVETLTADGCAREASHPKLGRTWVRVIGRTMWVKANDRAGEVMGRTPTQIELFRARWIKYPAPAAMRDCDLGYLLPAPGDDDLLDAAGMTKVEGKQGQRFDFGGGGLSVSFVIATKGPPLMISYRIEGEPGALTELPVDLGFAGTTVLEETDTGAEVEPPPQRIVIDPADFQTLPA